MNKHTPGPWRVGGKEKRVIFAANGDVVARTAAYGEQSETPDAESGNATLIAAAPAMLALLKSIDECGVFGEEDWSRIAAVIAQATN